jgi:putative tryptophan/tyrosine transport system substrate-binding protein
LITAIRPFDLAQDRLTALGNSRKRIIVAAVCAVLFAFCTHAEAQQTTKVSRIGFLTATTASGSADLLEAFRQEMRKLGWIEGKNITIEYRFGEQKRERVPELAADLVRLKVDVIVVDVTPAALAVKKATTTIPIVMVNAGGPRRCRFDCQSGAARR